MTSQQLDLLAPGRSRASDPDTSKEAAEQVRAFGARQRRLVLACLVMAGQAGRTDWEVSGATGILPNAVATRRGELRRAGLVEKTDRRRRTINSSAFVWQATELGVRTLREWESV